MFYNRDMEAISKLRDLSTFMHLEPAGERPRAPFPDDGRPTMDGGALTGSGVGVAPCGMVVETKARKKRKKHDENGVFHAAMPGGKTMPLLKTLLTSACERNCNYCPFRAGRNYRRTTFKPQEMAKIYMDMVRAGLVRGLFLSSGIIGGGMKTQDKLIDTVEILRHKHHFKGYVHLKVMPGAEKAQIERSMQLANRLSVNLEAPNDGRLSTLAPMKNFGEELVRPLRWIEEIRQSQPASMGWNGRWPSTTTQFVVGGGDESDLELLATSEFLYKRLNLQRAYFMAFNPIRDTPLENRPAENPWREYRLYQASFLFRDYGFDLEEMPFTQEGNLPLDRDPKQAWAQTNLRDEPVEVNRAGRQELLRVPGVGPKSATTIVQARRQGTLRDIQHLRQLGIRTGPMEPYVLLDGTRPTRQLRLFP